MEKITKTKLYDRVISSAEPSNSPNSLHGCEPIYILSAIDIKPVTLKQLYKEFEIFKLKYQTWRGKSFYDFLKWKADFYETKYCIDTYDTAYFLNLDTAIEYAKSNMSDINESGAYPYLVIYTRPTNHMHAEANPCMVKLFVYNKDTDEYIEIENIESDERYIYIVSRFDMFRKPQKETV